MNRVLKTYERIVGSNAISQLRQLARDLTGARVVHVNSTRVGGGVAEILDWLVPLMNDVGLETSWEVIRGPAVFYQTTKAFHNGLQGADVRLTQRMIEIYERTVAECAEELRPTLEAADLVIINQFRSDGKEGNLNLYTVLSHASE